jgi:hypothetical protein
MTIEYAEQNGFVPLTNGYKLPHEKWMMDNAIADAQRNNKEICLISTNTGIEIWQKTKQKQAQTTTEQ